MTAFNKKAAMYCRSANEPSAKFSQSQRRHSIYCVCIYSCSQKGSGDFLLWFVCSSACNPAPSDLIKHPEGLLDVLSGLSLPLSLHHQAAELSAATNIMFSFPPTSQYYIIEVQEIHTDHRLYGYLWIFISASCKYGSKYW